MEKNLKDFLPMKELMDLITECVEDTMVRKLGPKVAKSNSWYGIIPKTSRFCFTCKKYGHVCDQCFFRPLKTPFAFFLKIAPDDHAYILDVFPELDIMDIPELKMGVVAVTSYGEKSKLDSWLKTKPQITRLKKTWSKMDSPELDKRFVEFLKDVKKRKHRAKVKKFKQPPILRDTRTPMVMANEETKTVNLAEAAKAAKQAKEVKKPEAKKINKKSKNKRNKKKSPPVDLNQAIDLMAAASAKALNDVLSKKGFCQVKEILLLVARHQERRYQQSPARYIHLLDMSLYMRVYEGLTLNQRIILSQPKSQRYGMLMHAGFPLGPVEG